MYWRHFCMRMQNEKWYFININSVKGRLTIIHIFHMQGQLGRLGEVDRAAASIP